MSDSVQPLPGGSPARLGVRLEFEVIDGAPARALRAQQAAVVRGLLIWAQNLDQQSTSPVQSGSHDADSRHDVYPEAA